MCKSQIMSTPCQDQKFEMVIVIAVLVCGILVLIVLYLKHKFFDNDREMAGHHQQRSSNTCFLSNDNAADRSESSAFHSISFTTGPSTSNSDSAAFDCRSCAICLDDYVDGDRVVVLQACLHVFHEECIDQWIPWRSSNCPVCRAKVMERMKGEPSRRRPAQCPLAFSLAYSNGFITNSHSARVI
ncbi:probable E3 ubiquitin-protein ligase ATL44 [Punica granatum]|uniref:RING-type E3 ubiquitin transferase n=1 Tax=Punica granatum TaxID=22663 RepID=A0A6P8EB74_PUNGR|nr:probable E3 ubiquitin-protein ligase ATL44 [Punica granatum]